MTLQKKSSPPDIAGCDAMDCLADLETFYWRPEEEAQSLTDDSAGTGARSSTDESTGMADLPAEAIKECSKCHESSPLSNFYDRSKGGKQSWCIPCTKQFAKELKIAKKRTYPEAEADNEDAAIQERAADHLYIMENPRIRGEVKIGRSQTPEDRAKQLSSGNNFNLQVLQVFLGRGYLEQTIHLRLKCRRVENVAGREWFQVSRDQADTIIKSAILEDELRQAASGGT